MPPPKNIFLIFFFKLKLKVGYGKKLRPLGYMYVCVFVLLQTNKDTFLGDWFSKKGYKISQYNLLQKFLILIFNGTKKITFSQQNFHIPISLPRIKWVVESRRFPRNFGLFSFWLIKSHFFPLFGDEGQKEDTSQLSY